MTTLAFNVEGMTCDHCGSRVRDAIAQIDGADHIDVDVDHDRATVEIGDRQRQAVGDLAAAVESALDEAGYPGTFDPGLAKSGFSESGSTKPATDEPASAKRKSEPQLPADSDASLATPAAAGADLRLDVGGMTCASCVATVEEALADTDGVADARVNFATERASIRLDDARPNSDMTGRLRRAVEDVGYEVLDAQPSQTDQPHLDDQPPSSRRPEGSGLSQRRAAEAGDWKQRWVTGLVLTVPIVLLQMGPGWFGLGLDGAANAWRLGLAGYLTTVVMVYVGRPYFRGAWTNLVHLRANMDTLIALGSSVAWAFSAVVTAAALAGHHIAGGEVYFDGAAMILTLISVGKWLEARAKGRAGQAIESLLDLQATTARVRRDDQWVEVAVDQLAAGDELLVKPGEKIPTDSVIIEGQADIDESMITGESVPVTRGEDDQAIGATINTDGRLVVRVSRVGDDTALAQIIELVERAQESKADIQRLADKVSAVFVPAIIAISGLTLVGWLVSGHSVGQAVLPAIAVLIVACPCALGLATPTAMMVGTGKAAKLGILIRDAQALEWARALDVMVFDKTGTLTTAAMTVTDVDARIDEADFLGRCAALEAPSEHPVGQAIVDHAHDQGIQPTDVTDFRAVAGDGVQGVVAGAHLRLGKPSWVLGNDKTHADDQIRALQNEGKTVVALAEDDQFLGVIAVGDHIKDQAQPTLQWLVDHGIQPWMITGDNAATASAVAAEVGIDADHVKAGVRPEHKARAVAALQSQTDRRIVAMVGDGINDAPALAEADLGIAIGTGADVAIEAADITLVSGDIAGVRRAIELSRQTYAKIKQNLFWAFAYNSVLVPVAAFGLLMPAMAAGAMALSSVSVVSNSLLLKRRTL